MSMTRLLQTLLELEGHESLATPRPEEVVETVRQARPDVIVMDLHLGQSDTTSILRTLKGDPALKSIPIIIVSGMDAQDECAQAGAEAFILKPYSPNALLEMIKKLASSRAVL